MNRYKREGKQRFFSLFTAPVVVVTHWRDYETGEGGSAADSLTPKEAYSCLADGRWPADFFRIRTMADLRCAIADTNDHDHVEVFTLAEYADWKKERERKRLEGLAATICQKHDVAFGTPEFLTACQSEIDSERGFREGQQEDGLCAGGGITVEQYFDDRNYSRVLEERAWEVLEFCRRHTPLLWALWQENRLQAAIA